MITMLTAFFGTTMGQVGGSAAAATALAWILGKLSGFAAYQAARATAGRVLYRVGQGINKLGESRLGNLWAPLEDVATDWGYFLVEQFFAGLRADNVDKMEKHLDRLEDVGSESRAKAVAEKLATLGRMPEPLQTAQDAAIAAQAIATGDAATNDRLNQP